MAIDNQPTGTRENASERRVKALELRKAGASYRAIARQLNISERQAYKDVQQSLTHLAALEQASAEEYRALELMRLDMALLSLAPKMQTGDPQVVNAWVRVCESRRRLLGLDLQPGATLPADLEIILRWHGDRTNIIDVTPADDHAAAAPQLAAADSERPGAVSYRVRWEEMGQEPAGGDALPEDGA